MYWSMQERIAMLLQEKEEHESEIESLSTCVRP